MITKLLVRIKCPSWKVRRCSHAVQYIALFGVQSRWTKVIALSQGRFLLSENCFYQSSMVLEVSCSSTEAVKWPSNHTKFVKNVFIIIFSHQEGLSWQLHSFPFPVITFSFCAVFSQLVTLYRYASCPDHSTITQPHAWWSPVYYAVWHYQLPQYQYTFWFNINVIFLDTKRTSLMIQ